MEFQKTLLYSVSAAGLHLEDADLQKFVHYYEELLAWNLKINLTTIIQPSDAAIKHFLDSLLILKYVQLKGALIDIGTGPGFPGIPLKIMRPNLSVVLVESVRKKTSFLKHVIRELQLKDIEVYNGRIEALDRLATFDCAVSRAFSDLELFCRLAAPFVKPGGMIVAMKGRETPEQAAGFRMAQSGLICKAIHRYAFPYNCGDRALIVLEKCFT